MEDNPFPGLTISEASFLDDVEGRTKCGKCGQSRKYYCYTCCIPLEQFTDRIPNVKLPVKIDVIKHRNEVDGKSTAVHAAVLAPQHVTIHTYPCIPDYDKSKTVLVFPCKDSILLGDFLQQSITPSKIRDSKTEDTSPNKTVDNTEKTEDEAQPPQKVFKTCSAQDIHTDSKCSQIQAPFDTVVFIDSTWNQTKKIYMDERLQGLKTVEIKSYETKFWRHQKDKPTTYLATVEAIYYFLQEYHTNFVRDKYNGEYDDLLFFFLFMYKKIKHLYDGGKYLKAYSERPLDSESSTESNTKK